MGSMGSITNIMRRCIYHLCTCVSIYCSFGFKCSHLSTCVVSTCPLSPRGQDSRQLVRMFSNTHWPLLQYKSKVRLYQHQVKSTAAVTSTTIDDLAVDRRTSTCRKWHTSHRDVTLIKIHTSCLLPCRQEYLEWDCWQIRRAETTDRVHWLVV